MNENDRLLVRDIFDFYGEDSNDFNVVKKTDYDFFYLTEGKEKVMRSLDSFAYCLSAIKKVKETLSKDHTVLEYGCATGFNLEYLRRNGFNNVFGVDADEIYIEIGKTRFQDINIFVDNFKNKTCESFDPARFDTIFTRAVLQQKTDITQCPNVLKDDEVVNILKVFHSLLKPSGTLITIEGSKVRDWPSLFWRGGFKNTNSDGHFNAWEKINDATT